MHARLMLLVCVLAMVLSDHAASAPAGPGEGAVSFKDETTTRTDTIVVVGARLKEERPVGPYKQPEWTVTRRFPSTRVYVQTLPGKVEFEQWLEVRVPRESSKKTETRLRQEFAFGLGSRLQLDLYLNTRHVRDGAASAFDFRGWSAEMRWALADWGKIPGNPTLYFEYLFFNHAPDKIEPKLLLGGGMSARLRWGLNLIYEREVVVFEDRDEQFAVAASVGYAVIDEKLSLGPSAIFASTTERTAGSRSKTTTDVAVGPCVQFRPQPEAFLDVEPLFGVTNESRKLRMFIVFGWEF